VAEATGILDACGYLQQRLEQLQRELKELEALPDSPNNAIQIAALQTRIRKLIPETAYQLLLVKVNYQFDINGPTNVTHLDKELLHGETSVDVPWPIKFWMGAWDSDALCGYMKGTVSIPFKPFGPKLIA
jgi:hypothetical protein